MDVPKVSVCMVTYNHEQFIARAIEGVLQQRTAFSFELVIGEDCSTDNTFGIAKSYAMRHPEIVRLLSSYKNMGANNNFNRTLKECRGEYLAFCEGDDYWIKSDKLAKQVGVLENNPGYAICFHNVFVQYEGDEVPLYPYYLNDVTSSPIGIHDAKPPDISDVNRLLRGNYIQKPAVMMRHIFPDGLPTWLVGLPLGDWPLNVFVARNGKIIYLDEILAVYRIHSGGVWSSGGVEDRSDEVIKAAYAIRENLNWSLGKRFILNSYLCSMHVYSAQRLRQVGNFRAALSRVLHMFSVKGNRQPAFILAFVYIVSRRLLPQRLFDCLFAVRRKLMCRK